MRNSGSLMEALTRILARILKQDPTLKMGIQEAQIIEEWPLVVGAAIAKHTRAFQIKNKTLMIEVDHPIWKQELHSNKQLALKKLNDRIHEKIDPNYHIEDLFLVSPQPKRNQTK